MIWQRLVLALGLAALLPAWAAPTLSVRDTVTQGAMVRGQTTAGATVTMNGQSLPVTPEGAFVFAVARAYEGTVTVRATDPQGQTAALELPVDAILSPGAASPALVDQIAGIGPFGVGSPEPVFALQSVHVTGVRQVGLNHLKFTAEDSSGRLDCIAWRSADQPLGEVIRPNARLHVVGKLKADEWNGRRRVQLDVSDAAEA